MAVRELPRLHDIQKDIVFEVIKKQAGLNGIHVADLMTKTHLDCGTLISVVDELKAEHKVRELAEQAPLLVFALDQDHHP